MSLLTLTLPSALDLAVTRASVTEAASAPFGLQVTAFSPDPSLPLAAIVGQPATFAAVAGYVHALGLGTRLWSGVVRHAEQVHAVSIGVGEKAVSTYRFDIVPRLWLLTHRRGYRIFQHLSIPDIIDQLLGEWHIKPTWRIDRGAYPKLEYKVQYGESDHAFYSRLLEEAGISYVFEGGAGGSTLVLGDQLQAAAPRPGLPLRFVDNPNDAAELEYVTNVRWMREVRPGARTLRDQDFRNPSRQLFEHAPKVSGFEGQLEQYEYDGGAFLVETDKGGGDTPAADDKSIARHEAAYGNGRAVRDLAAYRTGARAVELETNAVDLCPGMVISIEGHPHAALPPSARLLVIKTELVALSQGEWKLRAVAVPADADHRPAKRTPRPLAHGFQSAKVVGPPGQEIYTDEFGRVRVQFPWDREGKNDDRSSCWVRVHEGWGGLGYGRIALPRIGQEVLVTFLEGDPDQPVIAGRAYNAVEQVPYKLPDHKTRSTWKSNSSLGGGGFNEVMFEDLKDSELVWEQAQKDRVRLVKHDEIATVGHDRQVTVKNDLREQTDGHRRAFVGKDIDHVVKHNMRQRIEGDSHALVVGDVRQRIDGDLSLTVLDDQQEEVGGSYALRAGKQVHLVAADNTAGEAQDVTVKSVGGFLRIDAAGVTISGLVVNINTGGAPGRGKGSKPQEPHDPPHFTRHVTPEKKPVAVKDNVEKRKTKIVLCEIKTVQLECEHQGKRKFKVAFPTPSGAKPPNDIVEVVAADKSHAEKIKTTIVLAKPRCATHKPHALTVQGPQTLDHKAEDVSTAEVFYGDEDVRTRPLNYFWPWKMAPKSYTFSPHACSGPSAPITVRVYPNIEPSLSFELSLDTEERMIDKINKAKTAGRVEKRGRPPFTTWKLECKAKVKYGSQSVEVAKSFDDKLKKLAAVNLLVKRVIDKFCEYFYKFLGVVVLPVFPKLSLAYEGKFAEIEGSWRVGAEWSIKFKADPLIGITFKLDIIDVFIKAIQKTQFAVVGKALEKIRAWAKDKGQKFELWLGLSGMIGGEVGAKKNAAAAKAGVNGMIEGKVKAEFSAAASLGSKAVVSMGAGAEAKGETGLSAQLSLDNDDKGVFLKGKLMLLACKFKYVAWLSGKVIWEFKEQHEGEHTFWEDQDLLKTGDHYVLTRAA